jgi:hypothetical protein
VTLARPIVDGLQPIANHGLLVFRADGTLADYMSPVAQELRTREILKLLEQGTAAGLPARGTMQIAPKADGGYTAQVVVDHDEGSNPHRMIYDLENPQGVRDDLEWVLRLQDTGKILSDAKRRAVRRAT